MRRKLRKFAPEVWDRWLTVMADCYAPAVNRNCEACVYKWDDAFCRPCLFCEIFLTCRECMPGVPHEEKVDRALERLENAGVFR